MSLTGHNEDSLASSNELNNDEDDTSEGDSEGEVEFREDGEDPFEAAVAQAKEREKAEAERQEALRLQKKNKKKTSGKKAKQPPSAPTAASTPAPRRAKGQEGPGASQEQSIVVEKEVRSKQKPKKKSSANSANSGEKSPEQGSSKSRRRRRKESSSSESSETGDEEERSQEDLQVSEPEPEKRPKKKKKKSHKKSGSDSEDAAKWLVAGLKSLTKKRKKKSKKRARSSSSDSSSSDSDLGEETPVLTDKTWKLRDNGVDVLDMDLRHLLRAPTSSPDDWWKQPFRGRVSRPIRGAGMNMESCIGHARIHDSTIKRCHDRAALINTKMLLARNADVSIKDVKLVKIGADKLSYDRKWAQPETASEVAEAVQNYVALIYYIRGYSFEAISISRAFHDAGWLLGVVSSEKEQLELLEAVFDKLLSRNAQRARTFLPPMTHDQCRAAIRTFLHSKGKSEAGLYGVDPYAGRKRITEKDQMKQDVKASIIADLKQSGWSRPDHGGKDKKHRDRKEDRKSGKHSGAAKVASLCKDFNSPEGCPSQGDCSKGGHRCSKRKGDFVCQQNHSKTKCDHPRFQKN